ncbi:MAG: GIY-YIG nuclease family protein [bacterium]|nr:GIY-YIG nuclease family protein [bacterium]
MKFFYVYILYNPKNDFIYIGYSTNLKKRFEEHLSGQSKSTKGYLPIKLIHYEAYSNMKDAKRREKYLKTNHGKTTLKTMLKEYFSRSQM